MAYPVQRSPLPGGVARPLVKAKVRGLQPAALGFWGIDRGRPAE